ncbi:aldolase [Aeromicrobium sp. Root344]|uniref:class II aldolase/adducin family protein n=1 Tax=Aeromicrobium sp. Root344 TaxID=1736521 RepID=UPI0006FEAED4|nr:class II aldolase/adducin family protein [Aeromicrobium sp. Root344]KQV73817.1 aldolase [Aeromicrobium sp. Root344]
MHSTPELDEQRGAIAAACRRLAADGLVIGTAGNVSARVDDLVAITATGAAFETMTAEQVSVVDLTGRVVLGELAPTSELELHLGVYRDFAAGSVVHTHAPMATAVGCVVDVLPCVHYQMLLLGGEVRVAPYATFGTPELAANVHAALQGRTAALMANHGAVTYGGDLDKAVELAQLLEWACTVYWRAAAIGTPRALDAEAQAAVIEVAVQRGYGSSRPANDNHEDTA